MAQHKLRSRISQFKQPFLVSAASVALLAGCGGDTTSNTGANPDSGTSKGDDCPTAAPKDGAGCSNYEADLKCEYDSNTSCPRQFTCTDGEWVDGSPTCNPPPPEPLDECPSKLPAADAPCSLYEPGLACSYKAGSCDREFKCDDGVWVDESPTCNPPEPPLDECPQEMPTNGVECSDYEDELKCNYAVDTSCPREFSCVDGSWTDNSPTCNPPPPLTECPTELPELGTSCAEYQIGLDCSEPSCDGGVGVTCGRSREWEATFIACNPPGPVTDDADAGDTSDVADTSDAGFDASTPQDGG